MYRVPVVAALLLGLLGVGPAAAALPTLSPDLRLYVFRVEDRAEVLDPRTEDRVSTALHDLRTDEGYDLYVVYVRTFAGVDPDTWAFDQLRRVDVGHDGALLAVAVDDRAHAVAVPYGSSFPRATLVQAAGPALDRGDWAGAVLAGTDAIHGWTTPEIVRALVVAVSAPLLALVVIVALFDRRLTAWLQRRRQPRPPPPPPPVDPVPGVTTPELAYRADRALIGLDDAVRLREHDLGAARATFGEAAVASLAAALGSARTVLGEAFARRAQVDDRPGDVQGRTDLHRVATDCTAVGTRLDEARTALDRLYDLEQNVATALHRLRARVDAADARLPSSAALLAGLRARYAPFAVDAVTDDVTVATARLVDARAGLDRGEAELAAGRSAAAAVALRGAEEAAERAGALLDAVDRLAGELRDAGARFVEAAAEVRADLAEARVRNADGRSDELGAAVGRARAALRAAGPDVARGGGDPLTALRRLDEAGAALDRVLATVRAVRAEGERLAPRLDRAVLAAGSGIAAADGLVVRWRGVVGGPARTRLAEARRLLDTVDDLARRDPTGALARARRADALAQEALRLAAADVDERGDLDPS